MQRTFKIMSKVSGAILAALIVFFVVLGVSLILPKLFGLKPYIVMSGSMEPLIPTGAVAYIDTKDTNVEIGDIVAFYETEDVVVTHRIVAAGEYGFTTKGDANDNEDQNPVSRENIIGTYSFNIPGTGYLISDLSSKTINVAGKEIPTVIPFVIVLMIGLCIINLSLESLVGDDEQINKERRRIG